MTKFVNPSFSVYGDYSKDGEDNYERIFRKKDPGDRRPPLKDQGREDKPPVSPNKQD